MTHVEMVATNIANDVMEEICRIAPHIKDNEGKDAWKKLTEAVVKELAWRMDWNLKEKKL